MFLFVKNLMHSNIHVRCDKNPKKGCFEGLFLHVHIYVKSASFYKYLTFLKQHSINKKGILVLNSMTCKLYNLCIKMILAIFISENIVY